MPDEVRVSDRPQYALRFISGKYQGGEFPLKMNREVVVGRSSDLDMVLVEDMVSRKHAKISTMDNQITIQDLGSTNGTFVNGEKIKRVRLREGDRVLIGTSIIKLVTTDAPPPPPVEQVPEIRTTPTDQQEQRATLATVHQKPPTTARTMAGQIGEIGLPDLIQLLSTSKKSGVLDITSDDHTGHLYLRRGQIYYATLDNSGLDPRKAIYRMLVWDHGTFELQPPDEQTFSSELDEPTEGLLMEAMRQLDEIRQIEDRIPPATAQVRLNRPITSSLRDLSPLQLDMLQLVQNHGTVAGAIDSCSEPDLESYQALLELISREIVVLE